MAGKGVVIETVVRAIVIIVIIGLFIYFVVKYILGMKSLIG